MKSYEIPPKKFSLYKVNCGKVKVYFIKLNTIKLV